MKIIWTEFAIKSLQNIFTFYLMNADRKVAHKIRNQILETSKKLKKHPEIGPEEPNLEVLKKKHRYIISGNYKIIFRITNATVIISDVFDTRQDPSKMMDDDRF